MCKEKSDVGHLLSGVKEFKRRIRSLTVADSLDLSLFPQYDPICARTSDQCLSVRVFDPLYGSGEAPGDEKQQVCQVYQCSMSIQRKSMTTPV